MQIGAGLFVGSSEAPLVSPGLVAIDEFHLHIIVERPDGGVVAIEVKSARSVNPRDASGLTFLRDRLGDRFQCGILFHTGSLTARLGERVWAVPVAALWNGVSSAKDSLEDDRS